MSLTAEVEQLKFELDSTKKSQEIELEKLRKKIVSLEAKDKRRSKEMVIFFFYKDTLQNPTLQETPCRERTAHLPPVASTKF